LEKKLGQQVRLSACAILLPFGGEALYPVEGGEKGETKARLSSEGGGRGVSVRDVQEETREGIVYAVGFASCPFPRRRASFRPSDRGGERVPVGEGRRPRVSKKKAW